MSKTPNLNEKKTAAVIDVIRTRLKAGKEEGHFTELWTFLNTVGRFRALDPGDQILFFRLALTASKAATQTGYKTYTRAVLQALEDLNQFPDEYTGVRALFSASDVYESVGVWDTTKSKRNGRIAAVKKYLDAAVELGLIDINHLDHMKMSKIKRAATPASEEALLHAIERVVARITSRVGWWTIIAFRDLVLLDWKSYGFRSIEMTGITRDHFLSHPDGIPVHRSKSEKGKSTVILSETTRRLTHIYLASWDNYLEATGRPALSGSDPLFMGMRGEGLSSAAISSAVSALLPDNVRPHDLRARMGTLLGRIRGNDADIAAGLRIQRESVDAYSAASDASGIGADIAANHALAVLPDEVLERLGIVMEESDPTGHDSSSGSESPCWLPDWFDADDEPDAA